MRSDFLSRLKPVRLRQQLLFALHCAVWGLLAGACTAIVLAVARLGGVDVPPATAVGLSAAGLAVGSLVGLLWQRGWKQAARAVDERYRLKDRTETALEFLANPKAGQMHALQIADAVEHLGRVDAREVAPWTMPRALPYAVVALGAAIALIFLPVGPQSAEAGPAEPIAAIVREAELLEETMLQELEELAAQEKEQKLEELVEELKELVEEMKEPGVDLREALAKLSEMQAVVAATQSEFNLEAVDASLKQLGEALSPAAAMQAASDALQQGEYDKAAEALEQIDPSQISTKESRAAGEQLKKAAKKIEDANQGQISDAVAELIEGLENDNESQCKGGLCKLAGICKSQGLRKKIGECLGCQLAKLGECKGACQSNCQGNKNGGQGVARSDSPKQSWGLGASGQPLTDQATKIDATLNREDITGTAGDGPSEKEVSHSPEGREQATREYREKYAQYRRMNEAVLESEALPLGHRQTIRKYFESIRPQSEAAQPSGDE
jgi:tetratricopeptide (TPR) repeat protein